MCEKGEIIWRDVINTHKRNGPDIYRELYEINNLGDIRVYGTNEPVETRVDKFGKLIVDLVARNGASHRYIVGSLVSESFIPIINEADILEYIDGNEANPSLDNLEWIYVDEFTECGNFKNISEKRLTTPILNISTGISYENVYEAAKKCNIISGVIRHACKLGNNIVDMYGNRWMYVSEEFYNKNKDYHIIYRDTEELINILDIKKEKKKRTRKIVGSYKKKEDNIVIKPKKKKSTKTSKKKKSRWSKKQAMSGYSMYRSRMY